MTTVTKISTSGTSKYCGSKACPICSPLPSRPRGQHPLIASVNLLLARPVDHLLLRPILSKTTEYSAQHPNVQTCCLPRKAPGCNRAHMRKRLFTAGEGSGAPRGFWAEFHFLVKFVAEAGFLEECSQHNLISCCIIYLADPIQS